VIRFLIRRIALAILVLWLVTVGVFALFFIGPGPNQVARVMAGRLATAARIAQIRHDLHLDQPIYVQYWHWVWNLLHGDLGYDYYQGQSVESVIKLAAPITVSLVIGAAIIWLIYGVLTGVLSAVRSRSLLDRGFTASALTFYSMPTFVLGFSLIWLLSYEGNNLFGGFFIAHEQWISFTANPLGWARLLILPWITLALVTAATYTRLTRGSMLDVMGEDYIRTARSKGMRERRVVLRHGLRAALTPVVTQAGLDIGAALGGAVITEQVFGLPGLGWTAVQAINQQDLPLIMGIVILASVFVVVANLVVDMLYAVLDPRARLN